MTYEAPDIAVFEPGWERLPEALEFTYLVLMEPFGVDRAVALSHVEADAEHVAAIDRSGVLVGYLRLLPVAEDGSLQIRQVAVAPALHGRGLGRALMLAGEARARELGATLAWLNARKTAVPFYERLGYEIVSDEFASGLAGLVHLRMSKPLVPTGEDTPQPV